MKPVNRLDKEVWLRIQDLESCSAVKAYRDSSGCTRQITFVPLDSPTGQSIDSPAIFTMIMRRREGLKISDCHAFLCFSDETAVLLVNACQQAFANRSGWTNERPNLVELGLERAEEKLDNECYVDDVKDDCGPEYYEKPKLSGFFYAPRSDLIQKFKIGGEDGFGRIVTGEQPVIEHFTHCEPEPESAPECSCRSNHCCHQIQAIQLTPAVTFGGQAAAPAQQQQLMAIGGGIQQQQLIVPQQAQLYYGGGVDPAYDQYNVDRRALKKAQKKQKQLAQDDDAWKSPYRSGPVMNEYVTEEVRYVQQPQAAQPVYAKVLPRGGAEYRQDVRTSGVGDYGPPVGYSYGGDGDVYSRQLPVDAYNVYNGGAMQQQNFVIR